MDWTTDTLDGAVYKRLAARPEGDTVPELARLYQVDEDAILRSLMTLHGRRLVFLDGQRASARRWHDQSHLSARMEIPYVTPPVFADYCQDLDELCSELEHDGIEAFRPPTGEVEIVLTAATFVGGVLATAFLTQVGTRLAEFVGSVVSRRRDQGVDVVSIKGRFRTDDGTVIQFSVSGSDPKSVIGQFSELRDRLAATVDDPPGPR